MKAVLINVLNSRKKGAMNKDLAGGMGTFSSFGQGTLANIITKAKKRMIYLPVVTLINLNGIFREKGWDTTYVENKNNHFEGNPDLVLIYGSIVDYKYENEICKKIKKKHPNARIGVCGPFPTTKPKLYPDADFVFQGEPESYFLYEFKSLNDLKGVVKVEKQLDLNDLPPPNLDDFPIKKYSYFPALSKKPFIALAASKGCPYSCGYYCPYGTFQGPKYRLRDAKKSVDDIEFVTKNYGIKAIQYRDPTWGLNKKWIGEFVEELKARKIKVVFGIETRLDLLTEELLQSLFDVGLRNLNIGVETYNPDVAKMNKRMLIELGHQERIIKFCHKVGIKISAFYIIGLVGDDVSSVKRTIKYSKKLNTNIAQFAISIPYPGSKYYDDMKDKGFVTTEDYEKFNSAEIVFKHDILSKKELEKLKELAFVKYYFRPGYLIQQVKWLLKGY